MAYTYTEVKPQYVIEKLGKNANIIMCDFASRRMVNCDDMTVGAIQSFLEKDSVKFFEEVVTE